MSDFNNEIMDWTNEPKVEQRIKPLKPWPPPPPRPPMPPEERYRRRKYPDEMPTESGTYLVFTKLYKEHPRKYVEAMPWGEDFIKTSMWDNNVVEWTYMPPERTE
jgi:hypothetical protein